MTKNEFYANVFSAAQNRIEGGLSDKECDFITEALYDPKDPDDWSWSDFYDLMDCISEEDGNVVYAVSTNYEGAPDLEDEANFDLLADWVEQHPDVKKEIVEYYCKPFTVDQIDTHDLKQEILADEISGLDYELHLDCLLYILRNKKNAVKVGDQGFIKSGCPFGKKGYTVVEVHGDEITILSWDSTDKKVVKKDDFEIRQDEDEGEHNAPQPSQKWIKFCRESFATDEDWETVCEEAGVDPETTQTVTFCYITTIAVAKEGN